MLTAEMVLMEKVSGSRECIVKEYSPSGTRVADKAAVPVSACTDADPKDKALKSYCPRSARSNTLSHTLSQSRVPNLYLENVVVDRDV